MSTRTSARVIDALIRIDRDKVVRALAANGGDMTALDIARVVFPDTTSRGLDRNIRTIRALRRAQSDGVAQAGSDEHGNIIWRYAPRAAVAAYRRREAQDMLRRHNFDVQANRTPA